ncbi:MAG: DUF551 domain-containing protein [Kiritimatiellia bacterium]
MTHPKADGLDELKTAISNAICGNNDVHPADLFNVVCDTIDHLAQRGMINGGWSPIESAPRDGTFILLCGGETTEDDYSNEGVQKNRPVVAKFTPETHFDFDTEQEQEMWDMCYWDGAWRTAYIKPTHWMPLPAAPKMEGEE